MIRHCVFVRFRRDFGSEEGRAVFEQIAGMKARIPGLHAGHIGLDVSPDSGMDKGYAEGFMADFRNARARDAYLAHVEHQAVGRKLVAAAQGGIDGVFVHDIEVAE